MTLTNIIIILNIIGYILQNSFERADLIFGLNRYFYEAGLIWQPFTSMFMHGGLTHLAMNMVVLYQFGTLLENTKGSRYLFILYFLGGLLTSIGSFAFMYLLGFNHVLVGASGAISVLFGWIAYVDSFNRKGIIVAILLISFVPLLAGINIAWYAHIIGFIIGWIIAKITK
jgi:membrane associated rhomboid family serine protease